MVPGDNTQVVPIEGTMCAKDDEPKANCIIRDMTALGANMSQSNRVTLVLPISTTAQQLMSLVAESFSYKVDSFDLVLQIHNDSVDVSAKTTETLAEMGFDHEAHNRNNLILIVKDEEQYHRTQMPVEDANPSLNELHVGAAAGAGDGEALKSEPSASAYSETDYYCNKCSFNTNALIKHDIGYVGLVNQAMTCYLNSLLQTLFMTPEFRNALYRWEFDGKKEDEDKSIPFQLQKLFLQLQISKRHAIETTELTRSFGWDSSEAWQQHDVQELCRVMFDALEHKFHNTGQAHLINHLYQGKLKDYVKCLECGYESAREDTYLDIPLPVRPFGQTETYNSVEEALRAFVQPEVLEDTNQYLCEKCNKKCNAHKGLKFITFPYLLTLQLKRFDFDYNTMHRIKLNDKVTFPEVLNLNSFVVNDCETETNDDASTTDSGSALDEDLGPPVNSGTSESSVTMAMSDTVQDDDEGIDLGCSSGSTQNNQEVSANEKNLRHSASTKGPFVYELFSIMVHSGSANGGHYYAYIKSFKDGQWYCFNDQSVMKITHDDIRKTYGGGPSRGYYSGTYSCSTNAYMLMYRQIDKEKNAEAMCVGDFPEHTTKLVSSMQEQEELEQQQREIERNMCKIKLFCQHPIQNRLVDMRLRVNKDTTLAEATATAHKIMALDGVVSIDRCRLVKYDELHDSLECSFEDSDDVSMGELLGGAKSNYKFDLLLEIRPPDKPFQVYSPGGTTVKVFRIHLDKEEIDEPITVRGCLMDTVEVFQNQVLEALGCTCDAPVRMVLMKYSNDMRLLVNMTKTLKSEGFYRSTKVFVEYPSTEDAQVPFEQSRLCQILDRFEHTITLSVVLPAVSNEILEKLGIPLVYANYDVSANDEANFADGSAEGQAFTPPGDNNSGSPQNFDGDDEGIGDSECDNGGGAHGNGTSEGVSDQSEDSSLTDSDRTIVEWSSSQSRDVIMKWNESCSDETIEVKPDEAENLEYWDENCAGDESQEKFFFRAYPYYDPDDRMLRVLVDKRITLGAFKKYLEPYVCVATNYFKIYRLYAYNREFECSRLNENLAAFGDNTKVFVRLGRVLRKGEYNLKIYQLQLNNAEPAKFLLDWVISEGMTVLDAKKELLPEISSKCGLNFPLSQFRLRKKTWRTPGPILLDYRKFDEDIPMFANWEAFVEVLPGPDPLTQPTQMAVFLRRWRPSTFQVDSFEEIILDTSSVDELKEKVSQLSDIPTEFIDFAKGQGSFPCDTSLLTIHKDLDWNPQVSSLNSTPLYICDDGHVIYYKDNREQLKQLSEDEKREITNKEQTKFHNICSNSYSPRKERALKIYTDAVPTTTAVSSTEPDVD
uniref:Ubiquitin carboxyl-terminal hydrolase 47 n=1 Tax=Strigamia maritima TaxID=126957 RepID=T1J5G5_STRMM